MVKEAWPTLKQRLPALQFTIVGRNPAPQVQALAAADIVVTGTVDDVRPFYRRALALAVPLRVGSGTRLKILEAMAAGVPVVSSRLGAEGLDVVDGENILLADAATEVVSAITRLSADCALRARLIESGRKLVTDRYDWSSLGQRLYDIHRTGQRRT
jgi:glycosyltransferase involved in cell wall biosynthesis